MAANYVVLDSYKTVQVLSQQTVQDVQYVTAASLPTRITYSWAMPYEIWTAGPGSWTVLGAIATEFENLVTYEHVIAGSAVQDLDANGLLVDYTDVIVQYDRSAQGLPPLEGTVSIPIALIVLLEAEEGLPVPPGTQTPAELCGAEYDRLKALAGL